MSEFCRQCSIELFHEDFFEFEGLCLEGERVDVMCEGCGPTSVDSRGECLFHKEAGDTARLCFEAGEQERAKNYQERLKLELLGVCSYCLQDMHKEGEVCTEGA